MMSTVVLPGSGFPGASFPVRTDAQVPIGDPEDDEGGIGYDDDEDDEDDDADDDDTSDEDDDDDEEG